MKRKRKLKVSNQVTLDMLCQALGMAVVLCREKRGAGSLVNALLYADIIKDAATTDAEALFKDLKLPYYDTKLERIIRP